MKEGGGGGQTNQNECFARIAKRQSRTTSEIWWVAFIKYGFFLDNALKYV